MESAILVKWNQNISLIPPDGQGLFPAEVNPPTRDLLRRLKLESESVSNIIRTYNRKLANPLTSQVGAASGEQPPLPPPPPRPPHLHDLTIGVAQTARGRRGAAGPRLSLFSVQMERTQLRRRRRSQHVEETQKPQSSSSNMAASRR